MTEFLLFLGVLSLFILVVTAATIVWYIAVSVFSENM